MAEGVIIVTADGLISYANPMARKILGFDIDNQPTDFYNSGIWSYQNIDGSPLSKEEHPLQIALTTGTSIHDHEIALAKKSGSNSYISFNTAPLMNDKNKIIAVIGTFMDVTQRRILQQQKDDFIGIASHELRTPISSLKATLQLLDRQKINPDLKLLPILVEQSNKSLNKVNSLIGDLLNATRMSNGQLHLNKSSFVLAEMINEFISSIQSQTKIPINIDGDLSLVVEADKDRIEQVVINLINNAIKYAGNSDKIDILIEHSKSLAKISVKDSGPGISADKIPHLFDRYYRVDSSGKQYSGLGLGLYISSEIIKRHGGEINAESTPGVGTTFWFTIPIK